MKRNAQPAVDLYTTVDDELFDELSELIDQQVVHVDVWEDSLADALAGEELVAPTTSVDLDLYLEDGVYFELYGVQCFPDPEREPLADPAAIRTHLVDLIRRSIRLEDVAVDEEEALVLVLGRDQRPQLYLVVAGWLIDEWDELPDA
jgi:hypothetical protein